MVSNPGGKRENILLWIPTDNHVCSSVSDLDPFDMDPDPTCPFDADPDPAFQFDLDPDWTF
jgi:hypothetical protein